MHFIVESDAVDAQKIDKCDTIDIVVLVERMMRLRNHIFDRTPEETQRSINFRQALSRGTECETPVASMGNKRWSLWL